MDWTIEYYRDEKGKEPVADFIDSLAIDTQAKVFRLIDLLEEYGVLLKEPYTRQVRDKIRELRIKDTMEQYEFYILPIQADGLSYCMGLLRRPRKRLRKKLRLQKKG